ncbi:MAG: MMPL family transporter [SAR324 cluster bacterium]|nr:MMPL family transporter [SAR324 cluster bacterium]
MANLRVRIDDGFETFGRWLYRNRFKTLLMMLVVVAAFGSQLPRLTFDTSNESYFHEEDPTLREYDAFREQFGREEMLIIALRPPEVFDRAFLQWLADFHAALEAEVPYVKEITSLVNVRHTRGEGDELIVEDLLETLPRTPAEMARLKERVLSSELYRNFLVSEDGKFTTVVIETLAFSPGGEAGDLLAGFGEADEQPVGGQAVERMPLSQEENRELVLAARKVAAKFQSPDFPIHIAGGPALDEFFERTMQKDMGQFLGLAFLAIGIFLFVLFRRFSGVVLPLLVVILSLLSTVGLMAATGVSFTIPTTILPSFLLAVGVGASVHLLAIFYRDFQRRGDKEGAIVYALGHSGLPIVMTALTTAAGLYAFVTAEMAPIAHLGIFAGTGVLIALLYTLVLLPALLALWPVRQHARFGSGERSGGFDRLLTAIADFATSRALGIVVFSGVVVAAAIVGLFRLSFSMNFVEWIPRSQEIRRSIDLVDRELKGSSTLELVIDTGEENGLYEPAALNAMEALGRFAEQYRNDAGVQVVGKTNSLLNVLKETHRALNENRAEFYAIPQSRQLVAQELLLFENSGSDDLERLVDSQFSKARLTIVVPWDDAAVYVGFVQKIRAEAERLFEGRAIVTVTGTLNLFTQMMFAMMRSMAKSYVIAGVVITVMMMLLVGSLRIGLLSMVANLTPIMVTMGLVMGFAGIRLDAFTLLIGSIALGLAVDDTIHFFHNFRRYYGQGMDAREAVRQTLLTSGRAMLFTSLVLVTGFWLFMLATLNNVFYFGLLTGVALIFALLADFLLAPAMIMLVLRTQYGRTLTGKWSGAGAIASST